MSIRWTGASSPVRNNDRLDDETTEASNLPNELEEEPPESSSAKSMDDDGTSSETAHLQKQIDALSNSYLALEQE